MEEKNPKYSAETRAKIAAAVREAWKDKEKRAKRIVSMSNGMKKAWENRDENGLGQRENGALQEEVQRRISESVKERWEQGSYSNRLNGMTGKTAANHPDWSWGKRNFRDILLQFEEPICAFCGKTLTDEKLNVHHIDEDHDNYLLSNLQWACVSCHAWNFHYKDTGTRVKYPFVTLNKKFAFEYAHILPWHPGKCQNLHGHSGHLEVEVRGRINVLGVVQDFYDIGSIVKMVVVEPLDHKFLNDYMDNPTVENLLVEIWLRLERAGLKGLRSIKFAETDNSSASIDYHSMIESFGWNKNESGSWILVSKLAHESNQEEIKWCMGHALIECETVEKRLHGHDWHAVFEYEGFDKKQMEVFRMLQGWVLENWDYRMLVHYNHSILIPFTVGENQFSEEIQDLGLVPVGFNPTNENIKTYLHDLAIRHLGLDPSKLRVFVYDVIKKRNKE